jgi:hypothetical protein
MREKERGRGERDRQVDRETDRQIDEKREGETILVRERGAVRKEGREREIILFCCPCIGY